VKALNNISGVVYRHPAHHTLPPAVPPSISTERCDRYSNVY